MYGDIDVQETQLFNAKAVSAYYLMAPHHHLLGFVYVDDGFFGSFSFPAPFAASPEGVSRATNRARLNVDQCFREGWTIGDTSLMSAGSAYSTHTMFAHDPAATRSEATDGAPRPIPSTLPFASRLEQVIRAQKLLAECMRDTDDDVLTPALRGERKADAVYSLVQAESCAARTAAAADTLPVDSMECDPLLPSQRAGEDGRRVSLHQSTTSVQRGFIPLPIRSAERSRHQTRGSTEAMAASSAQSDGVQPLPPDGDDAMLCTQSGSNTVLSTGDYGSTKVVYGNTDSSGCSTSRSTQSDQLSHPSTQDAPTDATSSDQLSQARDMLFSGELSELCFHLALLTI